MASFALQYLGGYVVGSATYCPLLLTVKIKLSSETKVSKFDLHLIVKEEVAQFEVSMYNAMGV
jgi:hypothetical protein